MLCEISDSEKVKGDILFVHSSLPCYRIVSRCLRVRARRIENSPKFHVGAFFHPLNFSTCCVVLFFLVLFFKYYWDNMAERVLVISKVNAVFVVAVPTKLCVKKIHEKQKNSENMETIYLQVNYRDFYIALFHSCERLTKVCAYFSTAKKKEKRNIEIFVSSDIRGTIHNEDLEETKVV